MKENRKLSEDLTHRKGARKAEDIPAEVLGLLNRGEMETVNLTEWLAVDHQQLIQAAFPILGVSQEAIRLMSGEIASQKKPTAMNTTKLVGSMLYQQYPAQDELGRVLNALSTHPSDSIRCYAPYLIGLNDRLSIEDKLNQAQGLVADTHFGVREVVWMALRPAIDENLEESIRILSTWTSHEDENVRRFTTEATRPRGVWCKHIEELKSNPEMALPILEPLKADASKYVQDSVGNWLNDASKSKPEFVLHLCNRWKKESPTKETERIIKKARRTIDKK